MRETVSYATQSVGQDIENIIAAAALLITAYFVSKGSVKAFLPAMIITSILLRRRKPLGYVMAIPLLVFSVLTGIGYLPYFLL